ncbi:MAG: hypothetical protein WDN49_12955 [Acetobacteraceae bacterium]
MTTAILRRWGFRNVGLVTGVLAALALVACAGLYPWTPVAVTVVVLFAGGLARSMQFTVLNALAFADVPAARMSGGEQPGERGAADGDGHGRGGRRGGAASGGGAARGRSRWCWRISTWRLC